MKIAIIIALNLCFLYVAFGQTHTVLSGKIVSDDDGIPLSNVSIWERNSQSTAMTDAMGRFSLQLPDGEAILYFSHIGYKPKTVNLSLPHSDSLVVALASDTRELDEVVVSTGYEEIPIERTTGSFEVVDSALFNRQITPDVISRLDGLVAGVMFDKRSGGNRSFRIRGISTLNSSEQPLVILDNFPYEGDIRNINPNEVENVTFLKDAAAASIWGAKAGNGVLVITTKKAGKRSPFKIDVSSNLTVIGKPDLFYEPRMTSSDFIDIEQFLFSQGALDSRLNNSSSRPVITPVVEILQKERAGEISATTADELIDQYRSKDIRRDYERYFNRQALQQQHAVAISGGSENVSYRLALGYDRNLHQLVRNNDDRLTLRLNNSYTPSSKIEMTTDISYSVSNRQSNNPGIIRPGTTGTIYPYASLVDENGLPAVVEQQYRLSYVDTAGTGKLLDWKYRPLEELHQTDVKQKTDQLMLNFGTIYKILPGFSLTMKYQFANQTIADSDLKSEDLFYTRDYINRFTTIAGSTVIRNVPTGAIYDYGENKLSSHAVRGQLNLQELAIDNHKISAMVGAEARLAKSTLYQNRVYGYDHQLKTRQPVDLISRFPIYDRLSPLDLQIEDRQSFFEGNDRFVSFYANASYSYADRYTVSGSMRKDASNIFGTSTNNKWKPLWSAGLRWAVHNEPFFHSDIFDLVALRATYGHSGNVNNSVPAVTTIRYDNNLSALAGRRFAYIENPPNPDLRWENVSMTNIELAFSTRRGLFTGRLAYYHKKSTDLIGSVNMDRTTGYRLYTTNSAMTENTGIDVTLEHNSRFADINWHATVIYSNNNSKLLKYDYNNDLLYSYITGPGLRPPVEGHPLYSIFSYRWAGLDPQNGDPLGIDSEGNVSKDYNQLTRPSSIDEIVFNGTALPKHFGAFRNDFSFKDFAISINITYRFDYYFRRNTILYGALLNANPAVQHGDFAKRWQIPGDEHHTVVPSMTYPANANRDQFYANAEVTVEKGDHVRLQDVNVSYSLPRALINPLKIRQLKATLYANNLGIIWASNKAGRDPDYNQTPPSKTFAVGLTAQF